jgi:hypothetical protein
MPPRTPAARATSGRRVTDRPAVGDELRPAASQDGGAGRPAGAAGRRRTEAVPSGPPVLRVVPPAIDRDELDDTVAAGRTVPPGGSQPGRETDQPEDGAAGPSRRPLDEPATGIPAIATPGTGMPATPSPSARKPSTTTHDAAADVGLPDLDGPGEQAPGGPAAPARRRAGGQDWADVLFGAAPASPPSRRPPS